MKDIQFFLTLLFLVGILLFGRAAAQGTLDDASLSRTAATYYK
jgi:hypothetical protein